MTKYVIDTNFFFNLELKTGLGTNAKEIITEITQLGEKLKQQKKAEFYMPPKILDEFFTFVDKGDQYVQHFLSVMIVKEPHTSQLQFSADLFYDLVEEMRHRAYRGLQISEEELNTVARSMMGKEELGKIEYQKVFGEYKKRLRDRYRQATRFKFLDSVADLDLIVLSKEIDGHLVTSDEGVIRWGRLFGVKEVIPQTLKQQLQSLLA